MAENWWVALLIGFVLGLAGLWLALVLVMVVVRPRKDLLGESLRLLPDVVRLLTRLAGDPDLSRGVRVTLRLLLVYLALPIDLIPDFIPVLGYADDAIIVTVVLRRVARRVGIDALRGHWPGTEDGFFALCRLTGMHG